VDAVIGIPINSTLFRSLSTYLMSVGGVLMGFIGNQAAFNLSW
jgi:hypothetical protein